MSLPVSVDTVTLTGTYTDMDGTPLSGSVEFIAPSIIVHAVSKTIFADSTVVQLDETGSFSVVLVATDADDITPDSFVYQVSEKISGYSTHHRYTISLPKASPTADLADLIDVSNFL